MTVMIDLQSANVRFGASSPMFLEVFLKCEKYMKQVPSHAMDVPGFMWCGAHAQKAVKSSPEAFWAFVSEEDLVKNFTEINRVPEAMENLIVRKILDVTSLEGCHAIMRKLFPKDLVHSSSMKPKAVMQVKEVMFAVHFGCTTQPADSDPQRVEKCNATIISKENKIANALIAFPFGRAILYPDLYPNFSPPPFVSIFQMCIYNNKTYIYIYI